MKYYIFLEKHDQPWWRLGKTSNTFSHIKKSHILLIYQAKKRATIEMFTRKITHMQIKNIEKRSKFTQIVKDIHYRGKILIYIFYPFIKTGQRRPTSITTSTPLKKSQFASAHSELIKACFYYYMIRAWRTMEAPLRRL